MRAFVAVELPAEVRSRLAALNRQLAESQADVKWVEAQNLHVTMRFLGEMSEKPLEEVRRRLEAIGRAAPVCEAQLSQPGAFPSIRSPRVIWMGLGAGAKALARIAARIDKELRSLGIAPEARAFVAHVTLGRVRSSRRLDQLSRRLTEASWSPPGPFVVDHVTLFESRLSSAGPAYVPLARLPLTGT